MKQDDATYTVTISGPGFRLSADGISDESDMSDDERLGLALYRAFDMLRARVRCATQVVAELAQGVVEFGDTCPCEEIEIGAMVLHEAARNLVEAWRKYDERQEAEREERFPPKPTATTTDDRGGV